MTSRRLAVAGLALVLVTTGCGEDTAGADDETGLAMAEVDDVSSENDAPPENDASPGDSGGSDHEAHDSDVVAPSGGMSGTVVMGSDTPDVTDAPATTGVVVAVPAHARDAFLTAIGAAHDAPLAAIRSTFTPADGPPDVEVATISHEGGFSVMAGEQGDLLCVGDTAAEDDPTPPHQLWGCAEVSAETAAAATVTLEVSRTVVLRAS